jgi:hypothetical protein
MTVTYADLVRALSYIYIKLKLVTRHFGIMCQIISFIMSLQWVMGLRVPIRREDYGRQTHGFPRQQGKPLCVCG